MSKTTKRVWKQKLIKTTNIIINVTLVVYMSSASVLFLAPERAVAEDTFSLELPGDTVDTFSLGLPNNLMSKPDGRPPTIQYTLEGQKKDLSFTPGNICGDSGDCYAEGEDVPFKLTIDGLTASTAYTAKIQHDYLDTSSISGYDYFHTPGSWMVVQLVLP